ncbi:ABC transporter permease [Saccharopolyspora phatthalungensis]|uniref:Transport permease protein n=1 Tax=Saccharopolyspora phatthalungensis TaxID=664693 RepID=A0A840QJ24_9PSEU|nr:ABC transporter permease [Saccharopolyspora phatthalungensis]MBB5158725.1 ABC-type multidrug transport system permease subunit [Saccharopolyspora phatthalungensis]
MTQLWQLILARLRTYYREPGSVFWTFASPVLLALVLGVAFRGVPAGGGRDEEYVHFLIPGLIGMGLMSSGLWGVGYSIADMRIRKLVKRMVATPMSRAYFLFSFVVVRVVVILPELPILLVFGALVFGAPVRGSLVLLVVVVVLGALVFAGLGLLVAARTPNLQTASGLLSAATLPMYVGSGIFFPVSRFPDALQPVVKALPLTTANDTIRAVMLDGAGLVAVSGNLLILLAWAAGSFLIAVRIFRWSG